MICQILEQIAFTKIVFKDFFAGLCPTMNYNLTSNQTSGDLREIANYAKSKNLGLYIGGGFWHLNTNEVNNLSSSEVKDFIREYPRKIFQYVNTKNTGETPTIINFFNEPVWADGINVGWSNSTYFKAYDNDGVEMLTQCYLAYFNAAQSKGLIIGKDYRLTIGLDGVFTPNKKAYFIHQGLLDVKKRIAQALNIPVDMVQLDVAMQMRVDVHSPYRNDYGFYPPARSPDEIKQALQLFSDIGPIHIVEFETNGEVEDPTRTQLIIRLFKNDI